MITMLLALALQEAPAPEAATPPPPACAGEEFRAFDFWIGSWNVFAANGDGAPAVATSKISRHSNGCAILEEWRPNRGPYGISVNALRSDGQWHQRWVGGGGAVVDFVGGPNDAGEMVLEGVWPGAAGPGTEPLVRMTYTKRENGSVRQYGQQSLDGGETWVDSFDFIYSRPPQIGFAPPGKPRNPYEDGEKN